MFETCRGREKIPRHTLYMDAPYAGRDYEQTNPCVKNFINYNRKKRRSPRRETSSPLHATIFLGNELQRIKKMVTARHKPGKIRVDAAPMKFPSACLPAEMSLGADKEAV